MSDRPCSVCCGSDFVGCFHQHGNDFERCRGCGFVRMSQAPNYDDLDDHYRDDRSHGEQVYQQHDAFLKRFDKILQTIETKTKPGRFLDVGCSYGNSLIAARDRGWDVTGVELSLPAAEYGIKEYGLDIRMERLHEAGYEPESFDAILMHHTLEHVADPDVLVGQVRDLLKPGGIHFQALPNYQSLKRKLLKHHWGYGITPGHLVHFGPKPLRRMLERCGFVVHGHTTPSAPDDPRFLWDVMKKFNWTGKFMAKRGRPGEAFDTQEYIDFLNEKKWAHWVVNKGWPYRLVRALGLGEEIYMLAQKPEQPEARA